MRVDRPNWKKVLPVAAGVGFMLVGFWGLILGPIAAVAFISARSGQQAAESGADDEARRLAAFMAEAAKGELARAGAPKSAAQAVAGTSAAAAAPTAGARKPTFDEIKQRVAQLDAKRAFDALATARLALLDNGRDAHAATEAALLTKRFAADNAQAAARQRAAANAIGASLAGGQAALARGVFSEFIAERTALPLSPPQWEALGRALLGQGDLMEAAWAMHAGALLAGDRVAAQKRLIEVAGKAAEVGQSAVAVKLYGTLLAKYPDSQYAEFVRANVKAEQKRLGGG
jgi:hypothetical protein